MRWMLAAVLAVSLYIASPFYAAWSLSEAVTSADTATLTRKVDWPGVRKSLKASLARYADLKPLVRTASQRVRPTMWQRFRSVFGYSMLDRFIDTYITPEGLPKLHRLRDSRHAQRARARARQTHRKMDVARASLAPTWLTRTQTFLKRVRRAEFVGLFEVELVMVDRIRTDRSIVSVFELKGFEWILTSVRVIRTTTPEVPQPVTGV
ncbi:MAG: DUF2939 domain-containing protein [Pseudomonadota bacterium]